MCQVNHTWKLLAVWWQARRSRNHQMTYRSFSPMACLKSQINTGPHALNETSHSFMTCVKKLVSCSVVKRQIYCRGGTLRLTVMGKAVVVARWWIWLHKNTLEVLEKVDFLILNQFLCRCSFLLRLCQGSVVEGIIRHVEPRGCLFSPWKTHLWCLLTFCIHYLLLKNFDLLTMQPARNIDSPFRDNF